MQPDYQITESKTLWSAKICFFSLTALLLLEQLFSSSNWKHHDQQIPYMYHHQNQYRQQKCHLGPLQNSPPHHQTRRCTSCFGWAHNEICQCMCSSFHQNEKNKQVSIFHLPAIIMLMLMLSMPTNLQSYDHIWQHF